MMEAIPADPRPAMWLAGVMCGLRPSELAGLRWPFVEIDSDAPSLRIAERAMEVDKKYVAPAAPKTERRRRSIGLHPLFVAAMPRHRKDQKMLQFASTQLLRADPKVHGVLHSDSELRLCPVDVLGRVLDAGTSEEVRGHCGTDICAHVTSWAL